MRDDLRSTTLADAAKWCRTCGQERDDDRPSLAELDPHDGPSEPLTGTLAAAFDRAVAAIGDMR